MGIIYTKSTIEHPVRRTRSAVVSKLLVDTGSEFWWIADEVVFAQPDDLQLLGARTLEGLKLTIDPARRRLVAAGPLPAATAA